MAANRNTQVALLGPGKPHTWVSEIDDPRPMMAFEVNLKWTIGYICHKKNWSVDAENMILTDAVPFFVISIVPVGEAAREFPFNLETHGLPPGSIPKS